MRASCTRHTSIRSTRSQTALSAIGSASIVNPGFTPVPSTATLAFLAASSIRLATSRFAFRGYAASSVVVTTGTRCLITSSNSGSTPLSEELVHSTATSGFDALIVFPISTPTFTRSLRVAPMMTPTSCPIFFESMSMAPTMRNPLRPAICLATAAPIGPRPTWRTRIMMRL